MQGWTIKRDYDYIEAKKTLIVELQEQIEILKESDDSKELHRARKALEKIISKARGVRQERQEEMDSAKEVIDVMKNIIDIAKVAREH